MDVADEHLIVRQLIFGIYVMGIIFFVVLVSCANFHTTDNTSQGRGPKLWVLAAAIFLLPHDHLSSSAYVMVSHKQYMEVRV